MKFALLLAAAVILVRDPTGKWAGDPLQPWFQSLQSKNGLYCCARADGHPLDDGEWDIKDNKYRIFIDGEWIVVPDEAVISGPNKFGKAIALSQDRGFDRVTLVVVAHARREARRTTAFANK